MNNQFGWFSKKKEFNNMKMKSFVNDKKLILADLSLVRNFGEIKL